MLERHIPNDGELGRMAIATDGIAMIRIQFAIVGECLRAPVHGDLGFRLKGTTVSGG